MKLGRPCLPCVGLIVLVGCLTLVIAPEPLLIPGEPQVLSFSNRLPVIVIDPGHGGNDEGAKNNGVFEKTETLAVALRLKELLAAYHIPTVMTRDSDKYVSLADRVAIANRLDDAIFVSIHFNQSQVRSVEGAETYYCEQKVPAQQEWTWVGLFADSSGPVSAESESLAGYIQVCLVAKTNAQDRGIKSRRLYVVRNTRCPSVLVEAGFLSNQLERQLLSNDDYKSRLAGGIADGIIDFIKNKRQYPAQMMAAAE